MLPSLPEGVTVDADGHLHSTGCDLVALAEQYGTPLYVISEDVFRKRCRAYSQAFAVHAAGAMVAYAGKALLTQAIAAIVASEGLHLDVVSAGEIYAALEAGFPGERLIFHGNNKTEDEIVYAREVGVGRFVVDNFRELDLLEGGASREPARVLVRVAPGIEAHTHDYIQTGGASTKFGFDLGSGQALEAVRRCVGSPRLAFAGLHAHIGSQLLDTVSVVPLVERLLDLAVDIRASLDVAVAELNLGGGAGIRYREEQALDPATLAASVIPAVTGGCQRRDLPVPVLAVEPGRSIVGEAGIALYRVGSQKRVAGVTPFVAVDGGMGDNIRPALYGAEYSVVVANRMHDGAEERVHVVGRYCESGDFLANDVELPTLAAGDLLAFFSAGAYQYPMASNYNRVPRPCLLLLSGGQAHVMVERETVADLCRLERIPGHLRPNVPNASVKG